MFNAITTKRFRKDVMRMKQRGKDVEKLITAIDLLIEGETLPQQYLDHPLRGKYTGRRECHIEPDWLLIYKLEKPNLILERTGTHSDLFR
ncbi:MAG: type II toxin-antitoxin system YafQ family toxin [Calditrichaceae bacterium]|nr:type II toxin-antitoxin system YafQ family toxin [Calditrichia bacterium]NUQ43091.1 type II toxin-antitoxin system YafQ family toxin [Calditrichaceae bacterium]